MASGSRVLRVHPRLAFLAALLLLAPFTKPAVAGDCVGQGSATILMRSDCEIGADAKIRMGGRPNAPYKLLMDYGNGPTDVPGIGTFCLDLGPNLTKVQTGRLNFKGFRAAHTTLPDGPALVGQMIAFQLAVRDSAAPNGVAISNGISFALYPIGHAGRACRPCDLEGCTPGYWKNHPSSWEETGFAPEDPLISVFDKPDCLLDCDPRFQDLKLIEALDLNGGPAECGGARNLMRAAVASLLNAADPYVNFTRTVDEVITDVNAALATCDRDTMLNLASALDTDNNLGCPLDGHHAGGGGGPILKECDSGIVSLGFIFPLFYEGDLPADIDIQVFEKGAPQNQIGEVSFPFDPNDPPVFPITGGGLTVTKVTVHRGVIVVHCTADASNFEHGRFPASTTFQGSVGDTVHVKNIDTSCETPIDVGSKFNPIFITEIEVRG